MNGASIYVYGYLSLIALEFGSDLQGFPVLPVVGTLVVLLVLMRVVEKAKQMSEDFKRDLVTHDQLRIQLLEWKAEILQELRGQGERQ